MNKKPKKNLKKINYKNPDRGDRIYWPGLIYINEDTLKEEGKNRFRLGDLNPQNMNRFYFSSASTLTRLLPIILFFDCNSRKSSFY